MFRAKQVASRLIRKERRFWPQFPERLKGGMIEKLADYWVTVAKDYSAVMKDIGLDAKKYPKKATGYLTAIAATLYAYETNPDELEYIDKIQSYMNESSLLTSKIRNPDIESHFNTVSDAINHGTLRRLNLGLFSLLWLDNYSEQCAQFKTQCTYLKPRYLTFHERIIDVGMVGKWWNINLMMDYFDVNPSEWPDDNNNKYKNIYENVVNRISNIL